MPFKFNLFKKPPKISTGIDISPGGFSVSSVSKENGKYFLEHFTYDYFQENVFRDGMIIKPDVFAEILKKTLDENNFDIKSVNVCISSNTVFSKTITLPDLPKEELKLIAPQEVSKNVPLSVNEINVDFQILENTKKENKVDVIICALSKVIARNIVESFSKAGLETDSLDVGSFAMIRTLANAEMINNPDSSYISVLIGYENTDINIVKNGMPIFSHNTQIGKKNVLEALIKGFGISRNEAENRLHQFSLILPGAEVPSDPDLNKASNLTKTVYGNIASEIQKTVEFYTSQNGQAFEPELIILGGSGVCIGNIDKYILNKLKIKTALCESLKNISYKPELLENKGIPLNIPSLTTSIGLALKGFEN